MMRRGFHSGRRLATFAAAAALILSLAGDRGRAAGVPAGIYGQDPLEVLELKVRPNVILVLDTSGSMQWWLPNNNFSLNSGDHPRSRLLQAKQVLRTVVQNNQEKVSFQMGTYTMFGNGLNNQGAGNHRFQYVANGQDASFMDTLATELTVRGAVGDSLGRGLQSWQIIYPEWGTLYFDEDQDASGGVNATCAATIPNLPRFFARGADLATALQDAMNAPSCQGNAVNKYTVSYSTGSGVFTFGRSSGNRYWRLAWGKTPNNIRNALAETSTSTTSWQTTGTRTTDAPWTLLYRQTGTGSSGTGLNSPWRFTEPIDGTNVNFYHMRAGRLWNGEVIRVNSSGEVCGMDFPTAATKTNPASIVVQAADSSCVATGDAAKFVFGGGSFTGNDRSCNGFRSKSQLIPCDLKIPPAPTQFTTIGPYIADELPLNANGDPADWSGDGKADYIEEMDGSWGTNYVNVSPSGKASGSTPIANSLIDIKGAANAADNSCITNAEAVYPGLDSITVTGNTGTCTERNFSRYWNTGLSTGPWAAVPPAQRAIKNHTDPKEKTIVIFVTDGDDTCSSRPGSLSSSSFTGSTNEQRARRAAYYAEELYRRIDPNQPASSVQTYMIGYGGSFPPPDSYYLNLIAWGGSGLGQGLTGQPDVNWQTDSETTIRNRRALCTTCQDAFIAPDGPTLARQLQSIIDQGASDGDFNAQQSITETIFEYVDNAQDQQGNYDFDPMDPKTRYGAIVPTRFISSFSLPGFKGQLRAYQNDGSGNAIERWSAGQKLTLAVSTSMATCNSGTVGGTVGECVFPQLHGRSSFSDPVTSPGSWAAKIQRRIYTTDRNGVFSCTGATCTGPWDPETLIDLGSGGTPPHRVTLWPPDPAVVPNDYTSPGSLDAAIGLPPDSPTDFPASSKDPDCRASSSTPKSYAQCWLDVLQRDFKACLGSNLPAGCTSSTTTTTMRAARREAREIILAFMAGATPRVEGTGIARTFASFGGASAQSILFKAREWALADSELATAAVITQPSPSEPDATAYVAEYRLYRDGVRDSSTRNPDTAGDQIRQGFGLTNPDGDNFESLGPRNNLKPVMTVVYAPANDMLHAFRAGPNCGSRTTACTELGGEELWGFVPYDQLHVLYLRPANQPQGRENHVYSLARGVRFADVFVPGAMTQKSIGGVPQDLLGAWRRVLFFGRGIGGKHVTALDVTGPGPFTTTALNTVGPIPLWSRGNPDTADGLTGGSLNGTVADKDWYAKMGETWSIPAVAFVNPTNSNTIYETDRYTSGINFAIFMGSGYGEAGEGTTHYAFDALSGDVIAAVDVEQTAQNYGIDRPGHPYRNAIVANSVSFNRSAFATLVAKAFNLNPHPWSNVSVRVYVSDTHGRLWKFLTDRPDVAIPAADLGADQPVGTAVALLAEPNDVQMTTVPVVLLSTGNDRRAAGPFRNFVFTDLGTDFDTATTGTSTDDGVTTFEPVKKNFARTFDQGNAVGGCTYTKEAVFRGTIQPTGTVECDGPLTGSRCEGTLLQRVFFGGTRLSVPNTKYAPPTPLACQASYPCPDETNPNKTCTSVYPCRSQFDSILYALGVKTGQAAYDLNASGDDAYRIFRDSRIAAITIQADPDPDRGGSRLAADEGLMGAGGNSDPEAPPDDGVPPTATTATANVVFTREPGSPAPAVRYGSTVCQ